MSFILILTMSMTCFLVSLADLGLVRLLGTGGDAGGLFEQDRRGGRFGDEGEALVLVDGDDHRQDVAALLLGGGVELLAERHDVDALLAERRADGRRGLAAPAGICNLICATTSLAITRFL